MSKVLQADTRAGRWSLAIFCLGLSAGLVMVFIGFGAQSFVRDKFDPYFFGEMGKSVARGEGFAAYGSLLKRRAPLYPLVIGGIYWIFGERPLLVQLLQCVLLAGTCWLVFDMGRRVFNLRTGIVAGVLCAFHPMMLRYVADLHLETLMTFLFTWTIWCTVRFSFAPTVRNGALLGVAGALGALTKAVVLLYPALFAALWLATLLWSPTTRQKAIAALPAVATIFVTMALLIAPWTARNYRATGHFVLISSGFSDAFLRGYIFSKPEYALLQKPPYTDAENESNALFRALARQAGTEWERDDYETDRILARAAKEKLLAEPGAFVRKSLVGLLTFWYEMTSRTNSLVAGLLALGAWLLALVGARRGWLEGRAVWLFLAPALHLNLLLAVLLALGRYSVPVLPGLLVLSAYGLDAVLARWDRVYA